MSGLTEGETYYVSFFDAFRANVQLYKAAPYSVSFNNRVIGIFEPVSSQFSQITTESFQADSTTGILTFRGLMFDSYDRAVAIDDVSINASHFISGVPEPETWAMMLFGFAGLGFAMRRRSNESMHVDLA